MNNILILSCVVYIVVFASASTLCTLVVFQPRITMLSLVWFCASLALATPAALDPPNLTTIQGQASRFKFYDMPTPEAGPCDLCTGPDGALWGEDILANRIFRIDPKTDKVEEFLIPFTLPVLNISLPNLAGRTAFACAIRPGADGNIYASNGEIVLAKYSLPAAQCPSHEQPVGKRQNFYSIALLTDIGESGGYAGSDTILRAMPSVLESSTQIALTGERIPCNALLTHLQASVTKWSK